MPGTGGWRTDCVLPLGRVRLDAGEHHLVLRARTKPGKTVANIRAITLRKR